MSLVSLKVKLLSGLLISLCIVSSSGCGAAETSASSGSYKDIFNSAYLSGGAKEQELARQAEKSLSSQDYLSASAVFLAAGYKPFVDGNFEMARSYLDKAFLAAKKLTAADQKQMFLLLSEMLSRARHVDDETYKYLAQQRLRTIQAQPGATADDRYRDIQSLAFSCARNKRFTEAESLLLATLADLGSVKPLPKNYGWCLSTLARIYENGGKIPLAKERYAQWLQFCKDSGDQQQYGRCLSSYTHFLISHDMAKEAVPIAVEYRKFATSPREAPWRNRVSFGTIARGLELVDIDEANNYFREAFENDKQATQHAMNIPYGNTVSEWSGMLQRYGRTSQALAVLREGMEFCKRAKWPNSLEDNMPQMTARYEEILRAGGKNAEADRLHATAESDLAAKKKSLNEENENKVAMAITDANAKPLSKIEALTTLAYRDMEAQRCADGKRKLEEALATYEKNASSDDSPRMYGHFLNISQRFAGCGFANESQAFLLRVIKAKMVFGFQESLISGSSCGWGRVPVTALDDLFPRKGLFTKNQDATQIKLFKELLEQAKADGKAKTVIFFLQHSISMKDFREDRIAELEEIERWRQKSIDGKEPSRVALLHSMIQTANEYLRLNKLDDAFNKCKAASDFAEVNPISGNRYIVALSNSFFNLADSFEKVGKLDMAEKVLLMGFKRSLAERRDGTSISVFPQIVALAKKFSNNGNNDAASRLLTSMLTICKDERGEDSTLTRSWLIQMSMFHFSCGQSEEGKQFARDVTASITKPGMTVASTITGSLPEFIQILKQHHCEGDARKLERKLKEIEAQHCAPSSKI